MTLIACVGNKNGEKHERERAAFGMDYTEKLARMEDGLQFLRRARHEEVITYTSKYLDLHDVRIVPSFTQETLPIWMVANPSAGAREEGVRRVLRRVAQLGDGWLTYNITPELLRERVDVLAQLRREEGQTETGQPVAVQVNYTIGDTEQEAVDIATRAWGRYNSRGVSIDKLRTISAIGTAKQAASFINELYAAGATEVLLHPLDDDTARQVERASTQFLPLLPTGAKLA
jgi:alkanesulfonate monooxygenase SsuD/methylene tetrahydromethanopterin reductase-like flavin-dependent oxidoreductase (luciferase family)